MLASCARLSRRLRDTALLIVPVFCVLIQTARAQDASPPAAGAPSPPDQAESLAVANAFLEAPTLEDKLRHVRDSERVDPLMRVFYAGREPGALEPGHNVLRAMSALEIEGLTCHPFHVPFKDGTNRLLTVVPTAAGPRVDWESYARHNPVPWKTFLAGKHEGPAPFRLILERANYFNYQFSDREKLSSYRITSPDLEQTLYGYALSDSKLDRRLRVLFATSNFGRRGAVHRLILELSDDSGSVEHSQVRITGLVAPSWVVIRPAPPPPEEGADSPRE